MHVSTLVSGPLYVLSSKECLTLIYIEALSIFSTLCCVFFFILNAFNRAHGGRGDRGSSKRNPGGDIQFTFTSSLSQQCYAIITA